MVAMSVTNVRWLPSSSRMTRESPVLETTTPETVLSPVVCAAAVPAKASIATASAARTRLMVFLPCSCGSAVGSARPMELQLRCHGGDHGTVLAASQRGRDGGTAEWDFRHVVAARRSRCCSPSSLRRRARRCTTSSMRIAFYTCAEGLRPCLTRLGNQPIPFRSVAVGDRTLLGRWLYIEDLGGWVLASDTGAALAKNGLDVFIGEARDGAPRPPPGGSALERDGLRGRGSGDLERSHRAREGVVGQRIEDLVAPHPASARHVDTVAEVTSWPEAEPAAMLHR